MTNVLRSTTECVEQTLARVGKHVVLAAPLGLGKPVQLMNAFYQRVASDPSLSLHIVSALSLEVPRPANDLEANLAGPILARLFGDYEELAYVAPSRAGTLPDNIQVTELYFRAGSMKGSPAAQQNYISSNYTHIVRDMRGLGINVMAQMVAARDGDNGLELSLSGNTDLTLEMIDARAQNTEPLLLLAQVHPDLPFMELDARVSVDTFDAIVKNSVYDKALFAVPNGAVPLQDYATALHASSLITDGGTLQIGIGSLGDAVAQACLLRHENNADYRSILAGLQGAGNTLTEALTTFEQGLYVSTEMFVNGIMHLIERGVVKRRVYDNLTLQQGLNSGSIRPHIDADLFDHAREHGLMPQQLNTSSLAQLQYWGILPDDLSLHEEQLMLGGQMFSNDMDDGQTREWLLREMAGSTLRNGRILHGGFFLGPRDFYRKLRGLDPADQSQICMTGVRRTNQLLLDVPLYSAQRRQARFINTGMMVSLDGSVVSDALEDGTVISGVGGQYNFVAMAQDLPDARSILCIRSTRGQGTDTKSNIVPAYAYTTIPKHLRDVVVTEYGVADLRGQSDSQIIERLINIADSRFQDTLLADARARGKVSPNYAVPPDARNNTPQHLQQVLAPHQKSGLLPDYPFGTQLTDQELALGASLRHIKSLSDEPTRFIASAFRALLNKSDAQAAKPFLERVQLEHPETSREFLVQRLLLLELEERGLLRTG